MATISGAIETLRQRGIGGLLSRSGEYLKWKMKRRVYPVRRRAHAVLRRNKSRSYERNLLPDTNAASDWNYHDEEWNRVIDRWEHRRLLQEGRALTVADNEQDPGERITWHDERSFSVSVPAGEEDRWVYLSLDPTQHSWRNFRWKFDVTRSSHFKELQFGFRYNGFYDRYRFRHQDDKFHYDVVENGAFRNSLNDVPYPMELGKSYSVRIEVVDNRFVLSVDGEVLLGDFDFARRFPRGSCAIILWEENSETPIEAEFDNMSVEEIVVG